MSPIVSEVASEGQVPKAAPAVTAVNKNASLTVQLECTNRTFLERSLEHDLKLEENFYKMRLCKSAAGYLPYCRMLDFPAGAQLRCVPGATACNPTPTRKLNCRPML